MVHLDVPLVSALNVPATQAVHTVDVTAAAALPYAPAAHTVQAEVPEVSALYAPATHAVQAKVPVDSAL